MAASTRRWLGSVLSAAIIAASFTPVLAGSAPAAAGDRVGFYDPATSVWSLDGGGSFVYGNPGDNPFMGDWNCDGVDTPGLHRAEDTAAGPAGKVYLRNSNSTGIAHVEYFFGDPGDQAFAGDFNGDGCDTVGLYRPSTGQVFLTNRLGSRNRGLGAAEITYRFDGQGLDLGGARAVAGDFDGDGIDTVALHLPATATVLGAGPARFTFGDPGDHLLVGAWGGGRDSLGVYRQATGEFHLAASAGDAVAAESRASRSGGVPLAWARTAVAAPPPLCDGVPATIYGTAGNDVLNGTNGDDVIAGLDGNDVIGGKGGNDLICGGDGADVLNGDAGNDVVFGDGGDDNVNGNDGNDRLHGGAGADIITGDKDDDTMFGDGGPDNMNGGQGNDFMDGGDGDDLMSGSNGVDTLLGRLGRDVLNGGPDFDTCDLGADGLLSKSKCENERPIANPVQVNAFEDGPTVTGSFSAFEPDGEPVTFAIVVGLGPGQGSVVNNGNGTFTFNPGADFQSLAEAAIQNVTFQYTASDPNGATSDPATVTVQVTGVDDPAFANDDDGGTIDEDAAAFVIGNVLANDGDPDNGENVSVSGPPNGTTGFSSSNGAKVVNNFDGTFLYDPNPPPPVDAPPGTVVVSYFQTLSRNEFVDDTFKYTVTSSNPASGSASADVTVRVNGVNDAPEANSQHVFTSGSPITITLTGSDVDAKDDLEFSIETAPTQGVLGSVVNQVGNVATVQYDPQGTDDFDQFTFKVDDGLATATATVTINPPANESPPNRPEPTGIVAKSYTVEVTAGTTAELVLNAAAPFNVPAQPGDIGDLVFTVTQPGAGTLGAVTHDTATPVRSARVTYDPGSFTGPSTSFTFEACGDTSPPTGPFCATGIVSILVSAPADPEPPAIGPLAGTVTPGGSVPIDLSLGFESVPPPEDDPPQPRALRPQARSNGTAPGVYFLVDTTGSMGTPLPTVIANIRSAITGVEAAFPGAQFGLGEYRDFPVTGVPAFAFRHLVAIGDDDGVGGENPNDVSDRVGSLVAAQGGDGAEGQFFAIDQLMGAANPAGFDPAGTSVLVLIGDNPAHDPVCIAVSGLTYDITEALVTSKLQGPAWSTSGGVALVADSRVHGIGLLQQPGLNADPATRSGDYPEGCRNGTAGQATRLAAATGGSVLVNATGTQLRDAIIAATPGLTPRPTFTFSVETLPAIGQLLDSTNAPVVAGVALPTAVITFKATGLTIGQKTSFKYKVVNNATELAALADVFVNVVVVGSCEINVDFCDFGRP